MGAAARRLTDLDQQGYVDVVDEGLVRRARAGDGQAMDQIISRYRGFVRLKASAYFLAGGDSEDLIQEGLIGLFKAVRDYRPEREASFRSFAELCVTRQIITAIKTATRFKHAPGADTGADMLRHDDRTRRPPPPSPAPPDHTAPPPLLSPSELDGAGWCHGQWCA